MDNVFQKLKGFFGYGDDEELDDEYTEEGEGYSDSAAVSAAPPRVQKRSPSSSGSNVVNIHGSSSLLGKLVVYRPVSYDDARNVIDNLKGRRPIIVNMEGIERETAQRILDFMFGACYAVDGRLYKINGRIFVVAPANCDVVGNPDDY